MFRCSWVAALSFLAACSGLGIGRTGAAYQPAMTFTERAYLVEAELDKRTHQPTGWGRIVGEAAVGWGDVTRGLFGFHFAYLLGGASSSVEGLPDGGGWSYPWHATGVVGLGPFALMVEYQKRTEQFTYDGGFGGELRSNAWVGYLGFAPIPPLGLSIGGGKLVDGALTMGTTDDRAAYGSSPASGMYLGFNIDAFLLGGGFLQNGFRPRLAFGYTRASADVMANVPSSYSSLSAQFEMVFTIF